MLSDWSLADTLSATIIFFKYNNLKSRALCLFQFYSSFEVNL
jgi:hypothetical protein